VPLLTLVTIPHRLVVQPLEVLVNGKSGRVLSECQDYRTDFEKEAGEAPQYTGLWYKYEDEIVEDLDLDPGDVVQVDLEEEVDRITLARQAEHFDMFDLALALRKGDNTRAAEILRALENTP
jgi:hypothetical protein